jgi:AAA domain
MTKAPDANDVLRSQGADALRALHDQAVRFGPNKANTDRTGTNGDRSSLLVSEWRKRELPPRDYLLENVLCTTSRWLISGDTGIGKTLFALELGFAMGASAHFVNWKGVARGQPPCIMYLDGEMPSETMKERIEAAAAIYGDEVKLFAYNRDDLGPDAMPPLNKPEGQTWLWHEIEAVKPDVIMFDSMMCLLVGPLAEEETWQPCAPLIRQLSARRIAQVWLNHTGHDTTRSFGTKTKEWEFDLVSMLSKHETDDTAVIHTFTKARLRTPHTAGLFKPQLLRRTEQGWISEATTVGGPKESAGVRKRTWLVDVYRDLSDDVPLGLGYNGAPVRKVALAAIRQTMIRRGYLATEDGQLPSSERKAFQRAREELIGSGQFAGDADHLWSLK